MNYTILPKRSLLFCLTVSLVLIFSNTSSAQMRQVYVDNVAGNQVYKLSMYSPSQGYVAFRDWVGYTTDSGRTYTRKYVTFGNVNYNGYSVNLTFGFGISGVKAFDQNTIILYGDYGFVPSILYSTNGGSSYTLIFHSQYDPFQLSGGIMDMAFPGNGSTGFATDADRIIKSTNQGLSWSVVRVEPGSEYNYVEAIDNNNVYAVSTGYQTSKIIKTTNGGASWQNVVLPSIPGGKLNYAHFLDAATGLLSMYDNNSNYYIYKTINGGSNWTLQNNIEATPFGCYKMKFTDANTGYALSGQNTVYKTFNSGAVWEPLPRDNNYTYLGYSHNDIQCLNANQLWAGGGHGFLELNTNAGGATIPKAYFRIDTTGLSVTNTVNLLNYSRTGYTYQWFLNGAPISTAYNTSYTHNVNQLRDTVKLVVSNGTLTDTLIKYQDFFMPVVVSSFTPTIGATGTNVTITGINFNGATSVRFGGVPASNFTVISNTQVNAVVGAGATGNVSVTTWQGTGALGTFTYFAPPTINLPVSVSDNILCKAESITVSIQNTQANVKYELIDSLNFSYGFVNSNGGTVAFYTSLISRSGNYRIKASRLNVVSSVVFTDKILILVEKTKSVFTPNRVNILPGEKINFTNQSLETQSFNWTFDQDANIGSSTAPNPQNIFYASAGQKTLSLISISSNGCRDTATGSAAFVYLKPLPELNCYAQNVHDSDFAYYPQSPASANKVLLAHDNGYYISGFGNRPVLKTSIGVPKNYPKDGTAYFAKYTTDGVLSWQISIGNSGKFNGAEKDSLGNIYVLGYCNVLKYLTLVNGDSIRISATVADTISWVTKYNGFILKLDSSGNYLWHTVLNDPSLTNQGYPVQGGLPEQIKKVGDKIVVTGTFLANLAYYNNGNSQTVAALTNSTYANDLQNNFIVRIKENGNLVWSTYYKNSAVNQLRKITDVGIDKFGSVYIAGSYEQQVVIRDAAGSSFTLTAPGYGYNTYLVKLDSMGIHQWRVYYYSSEARGLAVDSMGNAYITGKGGLLAINNSNNTVTNSSTVGYNLVKISAQGITKWAVGTVMAYYGYGNSVILKGGNVYTTGTLSQNNQYTSTFSLTSSDNSVVSNVLNVNEFFIANYDTAGILKRFSKSGSINAWYGTLVPNKLVIDNNQNFIVSGLAEYWGNGTRTFPCFGSTINTFGSDAFFTKLNPAYCYNFSPPVANAGPDRSSCGGYPVTIGTTAINGNNYSWISSPAGFTSTQAMPVVSPLTTTTYYLSVINGEGLITRDTVVVTTAPSPTANAGADQAICAGGAVTIGSAAVPGNTYDWTSNPAGFISAIADPTVTPSVTTQYFLSVTNAGGCIKRDTVLITVGSNLIPAVAITSSTTNTCAGANVSFTATPTNGGTTPVYQWKVNGVNAGTNSNTFNTTSLTNGSVVTVMLTSNLPCASQTTATSNAITITVSSVTPAVTITASATNICPGNNVIFTATPANGGTTPVYQWKKNGVNTGTNSNTYSSNSLSNGDIVSVSLTSNAACATPSVVNSNNISITVNAVAPASISISGVTNVNPGASTVISSTVNNGGSSPTYQWQDSTNTHSWLNINGATASTINYSPASTGNKLKCILTANNPCVANNSVTSNVLTFTVAPGITGLSFYPNPVSNYLIVDGLTLRESWETVHIVTMSGAKIITVPDLTGLTRVVVDVSGLPRGVYMCVLNSRFGYAEYYKFVKL